MNANEEAKDFIKSLENLNEKKYVILLKQLKELGATKSKQIKFDWKNQNAPSVVGECFDDDINDCYVKSVYADGNIIYVSLWAYYRQESMDEVVLNKISHDYANIIEYLIDWNWEDNYDNEDWEDDDEFDDKHVIVITSYGEVMLKQKEGFVECYIGDNYDDYLGDIDGASLEMNDGDLTKLVEKFLDKNL